jgi:ATP-dependent Clp protease ATP-binding subunit ClpA
MKPRHSASLLLVWKVAELEALHLNASKIEPVHLFLGLCKVVDVDLPELVSKNAPDRDEILEELLREVRRLRTIFRSAGPNAKALRRHLRRAAPEGRFSFVESEWLRRSSSAKEIFADAEHFAQASNQSVYPAHLLYATLLAEDKERDATLANLDISKKRLLGVAKRDVLTFQVGQVSSTRAARARWN